MLIVEHRLSEDGASRLLFRLVQQWTRAHVPVVLFALQRPTEGNAAPQPPDVEVLLPTGGGRRLRGVLLRALPQAVVRARRADVVVAGREIGWGLLVGWVASRLARRPFVIVVQSNPVRAIGRWTAAPSRRVLRPALRLAYRDADRLVCVSEGLVPHATRLGVGAERIAVARNGVDVEAVQRAGGVPAPALPEGPGPLVVGMGRLTDQKGFDLLVRACAQVAAGGRPHRLLVLGEGPDRAALQGLASELGVSASVFLPGFTADPLPVLAAADLYCLPSRNEGMPTTLAEALLLGVPCVAADCVSGPRFLLAGGEHGDLVPVEDVDALATAVARHLDDPQRLRGAARRGRAWASEHLGIQGAATELLDVLRGVADAGARPRRGGAGAPGTPAGHP